MKLLLITMITIFFISGCGEYSSSSKERIGTLNNFHKAGVNPNSLAYRSAHNSEQKNKDRENKIQISKIDSSAKIEIAKIRSQNQLLIAKVNAGAKTDVAKTDSTTKIQTTKINSISKKESIQNTLYITIAIIIAVVIALILLYFNNKRNRELQLKLQNDRLAHELLLKEREHDEQRLHKLLELAGSGKITQEMQEDIILTLTKPKTETTLIESN